MTAEEKANKQISIQCNSVGSTVNEYLEFMNATEERKNRIYTSYFGRIKELHSKNILTIAVSRFIPDDYDGMATLDLAPRPNMLKMQPEQYEAEYRYILKDFDKQEIRESLQKLADEKQQDIALLCYENSSKFCHRHILANWLNSVEGFDAIMEYPEQVRKSWFKRKNK